MGKFDIEMVGKIGSMALIRKEDNDIDYNIFSRLGAELKPGMIWVSSGATEIGRLDYIKRTGRELSGDLDAVKTDYAAQGQAILMQTYRQFIPEAYSVRQVLVEHRHFNEREKREHIKNLLLRCASQGAIPIINYNDAVNAEENRRMELTELRESHHGRVVECIDNDETAAEIAVLMRARILLILTSVHGIYEDPEDPSTLVEKITGRNAAEVLEAIAKMQKACVGASRAGASGARAKLQYVAEPVKAGTTVIIGHAQHKISELVSGKVKRTVIGIGL
ncbi:MAG: uridylate kinase [Bacillota bacterium]|nr:uridylate kinase [Bacillota bacterium]